MPRTSSQQGRAKPQLHVAIDIGGDLLQAGTLYSRPQIEQLVACVAALGARRIEWIAVNHGWNIEDDYPGGFDPLTCAVEAAHAAGLELHVVLKPFGLCSNFSVLPATLPVPDAGTVWRDAAGLHPEVWAPLARHPEYCMKRRPGDGRPSGPVRAINLVKADDKPGGLDPAHVSVWTGVATGRFTRYDAPFSVEESVAWRPFYRWTRMSRIVSLRGLAIPEDRRIIEVRVEPHAGASGFINDAAAMIELLGEGGHGIPCTPAFASPRGTPSASPWIGPRRELIAYFSHPTVQRAFEDTDTLCEHFRDMRGINFKHAQSNPLDLTAVGRVTVARGKEERIPIFNLAHAGARELLVARVREYVKRGVDGVNVRCCSHYRGAEDWEYGFDDIVLKQTGAGTNVAEVARINGAGLTTFMRETADLLHAAGKTMGVHVLAQMVRESDEDMVGSLPRNVAYDWRTWVREIADHVEFRGAFGYRPENLRDIVDRIALVCRDAGKPLSYQSNRRAVTFAGPHDELERDVGSALSRDEIGAYVLYETAHFTRLDSKGRVEGSPGIAALLKRHGLGDWES